MNDENELRLSMELPFENEIVVSTSKTENRVVLYSKKDIVEYADTLIKCEKFDDFFHLLGLISEKDIFHQLLEDEDFLILYLKYKLHVQHYQDIIQLLQV